MQATKQARSRQRRRNKEQTSHTQEAKKKAGIQSSKRTEQEKHSGAGLNKQGNETQVNHLGGIQDFQNKTGKYTTQIMKPGALAPDRGLTASSLLFQLASTDRPTLLNICHSGMNWAVFFPFYKKYQSIK